uniref:Transmembrane protein 134 n=1 Tax=Equus caballus TaxID=9796 RepID=A0A9L0SZD4_HORSE
MSAARPQFSIDDAFELSLEDAGPGPESSGVTRFGPLHFERRARFEVAEEDKQSRLRYQNLENDEDGAQPSSEPDGGVSTRDSVQTSIGSSQWSFSTISNSTQRSYRACCSWTQHPLIQKNRRVVLASFLLLLLGLVIPWGCGVTVPGRDLQWGLRVAIRRVQLWQLPSLLQEGRSPLASELSRVLASAPGVCVQGRELHCPHTPCTLASVRTGRLPYLV